MAATARAKVILKGSLTYSVGKVVFKKGQEQDVHGEQEITKFERDQRFLVQRVQETKKAAAAPTAPAPAAAPATGSGRRRPPKNSGGTS